MSSPKPVILVLVKGLGIGGAERLIAAGARYWDMSRFDYHVAYVLPWKDNLVPDLEDSGVGVTCIGGRRGMDPGTLARLRRLVRDLRVSLIHAHLPLTGIVARCVTRLPVVYTEHNLARSYRLPTRLLNWATYGRNAAVTVVSSAVADSLRGYPGPEPVLVENGIGPRELRDEGRDLRAELGLSNGTRLAVHVGNIRPHKGHETLVRAAERIFQRRDDIVVVSIGGEKNPGDLERLNALVSELGLDRNIRFLGRRPDALDYVAAADVYVNPSDVEGLPVSILEAMALARPVVATRVGGVPSVVVDGETGRLVEPSDPEALSAAIIDMVDAEHGGKDMGARAQKVVLERYGIDRMIRRFEETYDEVLAGSS